MAALGDGGRARSGAAERCCVRKWHGAIGWYGYGMGALWWVVQYRWEWWGLAVLVRLGIWDWYISMNTQDRLS